MIKIISIEKQEQKTDQKGNPCISYHSKVQTDDGGQITAYITVYDGTLTPGQTIDCKLESKTSQKTGKSYWSGYYHVKKVPTTTVNNPVTQKTPTSNGYTLQELDDLMAHCVTFGIEKAGNIEGCSAIINSLYISAVQNRCKVTKSAVESVKEKFTEKPLTDDTDFNDTPVDPSLY